MTWFDFLTTTQIAGNELWRILALGLSVLVGLLAARLAQTLFRSAADRLPESKPVIAVAFRSAGKGLSPLLIASGMKLGIGFLWIPEAVTDWLSTGLSVLMTVSIAWLLYCMAEVIDCWIMGAVSKTESKLDDMLAPMIRKSLRISIIILAAVQIAQVLSDKPITSLLAGLGVGGLAVALAAQDTIKNLFGSMVIFADKPFEVGDRIVVDGFDGPVEEVGFRSTRIRTLEGHLITVPNAELANKNIQNIGKRPYIRRVMNVTITYDTPPAKVDRAVEILEGLLENHEGMHPDFPPRVFFNDFNSASLNILVIYWYHPPAYWDYLAFTQRFNREVLRRFNEEGIEFAFPTQTLYLAGDSNRPLDVNLPRT